MRSLTVPVAVLTLAGSALVTACTSTASVPAQPPAALTVTTAGSAPATTTGSAAPALAATPTASSVGAVEFFRAQQAGCAQHAVATGNPAVETDRFSGATQLRDLGGGSYLVRDGRGTELVVQPAKGVVLPASGKATDAMPAPYGFGCSETVFVGGSD